MALLKEFIHENKRLVSVTLLLLLAQYITILYIPFLVAQIVDYGIVLGDIGVVYRSGLQMLTVAVLGVVISVMCSYYSAKIATELGTSLRLSIFDKVQTLSVTDIEDYGTSALVSRITSDVVNIQQVTVMLFQMILPGPFIGIVCIVMSYMVSPLMGHIALASLSIFLCVVIVVTKLSFPYLKAIQMYLDKMMLVLREFFVGVRIIRAFDTSEYEKKRTDKTFEDYANNMIQINRLFAILTPVSYSVLGFSMVAILWFGLTEVPSGNLQLGEITAVIEYTTLAVLTLVMAALVIVMLPRAYAAFLRIETIMGMNPSVIEHEIKTTTLDSTQDVIASFKNVSFDYDGKNNYAISNVSFELKRGQTTAIIGSTGSGKSTIAKLLLRLNDVSKGEVSVLNESVSDIAQETLHDIISYVPQKAFLFIGTVADNIKFHDKNLSDQAMIHAAKIAQAHDFVQTLEDGYESNVARGGSNFSGGQKQRLSIARALSKKSMLYIFDDSFSALDYQTDANLRRALRANFKDESLLIIAQRISSIMHADQIIVMNDGKVTAIGTHEELLKQSSVYQNFAKSQYINSEEN